MASNTPFDEIYAHRVYSAPAVLFAVDYDSGLEKDAEGYLGLAEKWFVFSMVWSVMAAADEDGRAKLDAFLRDVEVEDGIFFKS